MSMLPKPDLNVASFSVSCFFQRQESEKVLEEEIQPATGLRILKMSKTEWHQLLFGTVGAAMTGSFPFVFALLIGELFGVSIYSNSIV